MSTLLGGVVPVYAQESIATDPITVDRVVELVNESRLGHGKNIVSLDEDLSFAATLKVKDMFDRQYFSHDTPSGENPWYWVLKAGYDYKYAGENLAIHFESATSQHRAWMESPLHRKNILNENYRDIGIAIQTGLFQGKEATLVVQLFGTRMKEEELAVSSVREEYDAYKEEQGMVIQSLEDEVVDEEDSLMKGVILFTNNDSGGFFETVSRMLLFVIMTLSIILPFVLVFGVLLRDWYDDVYVSKFEA
jgi:hypothetical protein